MPAPKGTLPPNAGKGRPKGTKNKATKELKDMILGALDRAGGEDYLLDCALDEKTRAPFLNLCAKVLPKDINANVKLSTWVEALQKMPVDAHGH